MDELLSSRFRVAGGIEGTDSATLQSKHSPQGRLRAVARYVASAPRRPVPKTLDDIALELFGEPLENTTNSVANASETSAKRDSNANASDTSANDAFVTGRADTSVASGVPENFVMPDPPMREYKLRWRLPPRDGGGVGARMYARIDLKDRVERGFALNEEASDVRIALAVAQPSL